MVFVNAIKSNPVRAKKPERVTPVKTDVAAEAEAETEKKSKRKPK